MPACLSWLPFVWERPYKSLQRWHCYETWSECLCRYLQLAVMGLSIDWSTSCCSFSDSRNGLRLDSSSPFWRHCSLFNLKQNLATQLKHHWPGAIGVSDVSTTHATQRTSSSNIYIYMLVISSACLYYFLVWSALHFDSGAGQHCSHIVFATLLWHLSGLETSRWW